MNFDCIVEPFVFVLFKKNWFFNWFHMFHNNKSILVLLVRDFSSFESQYQSFLYNLAVCFFNLNLFDVRLSVIEKSHEGYQRKLKIWEDPHVCIN